jgi:hypothetical protein
VKVRIRLKIVGQIVGHINDVVDSMPEQMKLGIKAEKNPTFSEARNPAPFRHFPRTRMA